MREGKHLLKFFLSPHELISFLTPSPDLTRGWVQMWLPLGRCFSSGEGWALSQNLWTIRAGLYDLSGRRKRAPSYLHGIPTIPSAKINYLRQKLLKQD